MAIELPALPWAQDALAPHISAETIEYHYGKHHAGYVKKLNAAIEGTDLASKSLVDIIREGGATFNNAAQVWNHSFYWNSMKPGGGGAPSGAIADAINGSFGGYDKFCEAFANAAATQFGSGWAWLVAEGDKLAIQKTPNAETPITSERQAASHDRCLGARVLHRLPERAPGLHQSVPRFAGQLGLREREPEQLSRTT